MTLYSVWGMYLSTLSRDRDVCNTYTRHDYIKYIHYIRTPSPVNKYSAIYEDRSK